jgi:hypothetical protein
MKFGVFGCIVTFIPNFKAIPLLQGCGVALGLFLRRSPN